jgi:hypothetical protein
VQQQSQPLLVRELITRINQHCPGSCILLKQSQKSKFLMIMIANDIPCTDDIEVYATDLPPV